MYNQAPENYPCPFCRMISNGLCNEKDVVYESTNTFACMPLHRHLGSGPSLLVIPKQHVENLYDISEALLAEVSQVSKFIAMNMRALWNIQGISIWQHNEKAGSQDVWHFHNHVVGRLENDNVYHAKRVLMTPEERYTLANELRSHIERGKH